MDTILHHDRILVEKSDKGPKLKYFFEITSKNKAHIKAGTVPQTALSAPVNHIIHADKIVRAVVESWRRIQNA